MPKSGPKAENGIIAYIDGASRGNPGDAAYGVVLETADGQPLAKVKESLGIATNNVAEYQALLAALRFALEHSRLRLKVVSDSELLTRQLEGRYKVKSADLKPLHDEARRMIAKLESFSIQHVPREQNRCADRLANQALDELYYGADPQTQPAGFANPTPELLKVSATYRDGSLQPRRALPFAEGEELELEIRRKK